jgi:hypothetical protein
VSVFDAESVQLDDTLLLIDPEVARQYEASQSKPVRSTGDITGIGDKQVETPSDLTGGTGTGPDKTAEVGGGAPRPRSFHATVEVPPATAKMRLVQIAGVWSTFELDRSFHVSQQVRICRTPSQPFLNQPARRRVVGREEGRKPAEVFGCLLGRL